jgi:hypothetical protein
MLKPGLYEQVINQTLTDELSKIPEVRQSTAPIDKAEASKILSQYLSDVVQKGLDNVLDNGGDLSAQIELTNQIINVIENQTQEADFAALSVDQRAEQLFALLRENDPSLVLGKTAKDLPRPETSIAQSSLFTGAVHEPQMFSELKKEILSADEIDMLVSFIKWSGLRLIMDEPVDLGFDCPLDLHCTYTRDQLLVTMDYLTPSNVREGVKWLSEKKMDVFFITLNKADKDYSPTTMYNDYSINESLFHWQSQSTTTDTGSVGQRYINHRSQGSRVLLFVREFKTIWSERRRIRSWGQQTMCPTPAADQ